MSFGKGFSIFVIVFCLFGFFFQMAMGNYGGAIFQAALVGFNVWSFRRYHMN